MAFRLASITLFCNLLTACGTNEVAAQRTAITDWTADYNHVMSTGQQSVNYHIFYVHGGETVSVQTQGRIGSNLQTPENQNITLSEAIREKYVEAVDSIDFDNLQDTYTSDSPWADTTTVYFKFHSARGDKTVKIVTPDAGPVGVQTLYSSVLSLQF